MIAFDSNVLIYFLEGHEQFGQKARSVIIKAAKEGAAVSVLIKQETLAGFARRGQKILLPAQASIKQLDSIHFLDVTETICQRAAELTAGYGKKVYGYDAIHLATALENGVEEFYTNDYTLLEIGRIKQLKILPLEAA